MFFSCCHMFFLVAGMGTHKCKTKACVLPQLNDCLMFCSRALMLQLDKLYQLRSWVTSIVKLRQHEPNLDVAALVSWLGQSDEPYSFIAIFCILQTDLACCLERSNRTMRATAELANWSGKRRSQSRMSWISMTQRPWKPSLPLQSKLDKTRHPGQMKGLVPKSAFLDSSGSIAQLFAICLRCKIEVGNFSLW